MKQTNLLIYGATGSIGDSVLSLVRNNKDQFNIIGMTCNNNIKKLSRLSEEFNTKNIGIARFNKNINYKKYFPEKKIYFGLKEFSDLIKIKPDVIILGISGGSILNLALDIAKSGKVIGMANKECIVSLGSIIFDLAKLNKTKIIPLDSEHNSIYQLLKTYNHSYESITITASGGPFLKKKRNELRDVTIEDALAHPIWRMGKKISLDSATMINKGLELIEAKYFFDIDVNKINILIHPQAIIHGLISFHDGSVISFMSQPDMRVPISNLLFKNKRIKLSDLSLDLANIRTLNFLNVDTAKFPAVRIAREVAVLGGLAPHGFNYINDKLTNLFMKKKIGFLDIVNFNEITLNKFFSRNPNQKKPSINDIVEFNKWIDRNIYLGE